MVACATYVRECNGENIQGKAEAESVIALLQAVHLFLLRCLILRNESFSSLSAVISRLNFALL